MDGRFKRRNGLRNDKFHSLLEACLVSLFTSSKKHIFFLHLHIAKIFFSLMDILERLIDPNLTHFLEKQLTPWPSSVNTSNVE